MKISETILKLLLLVLTVSLFSCSDFDDEWRRGEFEGEHFKKLVVVGLSHELDRRKFYEEVAVRSLAAEGIEAEQGLEIFPQSLTEVSNNSDLITDLIIENEIDAVLMIKVLHEDETAYMMPEDHGHFHAYYGRWGKTIHSRAHGYYKQPERYFMIATLYNLKVLHEENEQTVVWRAADIIYNPAGNLPRKEKFINTAIDHLLSKGLVKQ